MINKIPYEETKEDVQEIKQYLDILKEKFKVNKGDEGNEYQH